MSSPGRSDGSPPPPRAYPPLSPKEPEKTRSGRLQINSSVCINMQMERLRASVAGASGYAGGELVRWLSRHPRVELAHLTAFREQGRPVADVFPNLRGFAAQTLNGTSSADMASDSDVVFLALPHGAAIAAAPALLDGGARVVDLG